MALSFGVGLLARVCVLGRRVLWFRSYISPGFRLRASYLRFGEYDLNLGPVTPQRLGFWGTPNLRPYKPQSVGA